MLLWTLMSLHIACLKIFDFWSNFLCCSGSNRGASSGQESIILLSFFSSQKSLAGIRGLWQQCHSWINRAWRPPRHEIENVIICCCFIYFALGMPAFGINVKCVLSTKKMFYKIRLKETFMTQRILSIGSEDVYFLYTKMIICSAISLKFLNWKIKH